MYQRPTWGAANLKKSDASVTRSLKVDRFSNKVVEEENLFDLSEYFTEFYYFVMDDKFLPFTFMCEKANISVSMQRFRSTISFLAFMIIVYQVRCRCVSLN